MKKNYIGGRANKYGVFINYCGVIGNVKNGGVEYVINGEKRFTNDLKKFKREAENGTRR